MSFDSAVQFVIAEEGGFSADPNDPGGATKYGISQRAYPGLDIARLTKLDATNIYRRDYWDRLPSLPVPIDFIAFDFAVNAGIKTAVRALQLAIGVKDDGNFGPVSQRALISKPSIDVAILYSAERARHYALLDALDDHYARGWMRRTMRCFYHAIKSIEAAK